MLFRANCLAKGNSGVRLELIERLLTLLNHDILPLIPERGSCGASGDLIPLSYVGRALAGETEVLYEGEVREAADVLAELGLEPLRARGQGRPRDDQRHVVHERRSRRWPCTTPASWRSSPTSARRWPRRR